MEVLVVNSGNCRDPLLPVPGYLVCGPLGINTGRSFCGILAKKVKGNFVKKDQSEFSMPLNMLFMGPEQISLYLKDSNGKTYTFNGNQISSDGRYVMIMINSTKLMSLLQKNDTYKAVIEGDNWKCDFSFSGNMPK